MLVPFWFFAFLKVFFSTVIVRHFAHADTIGGQLYDAFVIGRAYWFAYAIFLMLSIAPLFWEKDDNTAPRKAIVGMTAAAVFSAVCSLKNYSLLPEVFQICRTVKCLPFFLSGMVLLLALANAIPESCRSLARTGKMSYQIMLFDPFYKVVLFAAAEKILGGVPLALIPLLAAADFALGVLSCVTARRIPVVKTLLGL